MLTFAAKRSTKIVLSLSCRFHGISFGRECNHRTCGSAQMQACHLSHPCDCDMVQWPQFATDIMLKNLLCAYTESVPFTSSHLGRALALDFASWDVFTATSTQQNEWSDKAWPLVLLRWFGAINGLRRTLKSQCISMRDQGRLRPYYGNLKKWNLVERNRIKISRELTDFLGSNSDDMASRGNKLFRIWRDGICWRTRSSSAPSLRWGSIYHQKGYQWRALEYSLYHNKSYRDYTALE